MSSITRNVLTTITTGTTEAAMVIKTDTAAIIKADIATMAKTITAKNTKRAGIATTMKKITAKSNTKVATATAIGIVENTIRTDIITKAISQATIKQNMTNTKVIVTSLTIAADIIIEQAIQQIRKAWLRELRISSRNYQASLP